MEPGLLLLSWLESNKDLPKLQPVVASVVGKQQQSA